MQASQARQGVRCSGIVTNCCCIPLLTLAGTKFCSNGWEKQHSTGD